MNYFSEPTVVSNHIKANAAATTQNICTILIPHLLFLKTKIPNEDTNKSI